MEDKDVGRNNLFWVIAVCAMALVLLCAAVIANGASGGVWLEPAMSGGRLFVQPTIRDGGPIKTEWFATYDRSPTWYEFKPKPDITSYELAKVLPVILHPPLPDQIDHEIMRLGTAARHFKRHPTQ